MIIEMVMCMLRDAQFGKEFRAEAANTAVYILNRIPARALNSKIPELCHSKVFGCTAYSHIPVKQRRKLDYKTKYTGS